MTRTSFWDEFATGRRGVGLWALVRGVLLCAALIGLLFVAAQIVLAAIDGQFNAPAQFAGVTALALAALVYLLGHGLRILRLTLLIGTWRVRLRDVASFHIMTAAVTLATPLKLGEIYRVFEMSYIVGGLTRAVAITWWERVFDASILLLLLVLALANTAEATPFRGVTVLMVLFVAVTAVVFFVAPDNLRRLSVLIIRRYESPSTVPVLQFIDIVRCAILEAPRLVRGKVASLLTLTVLIWLAQLGCFVIAMPALRGQWDAAVGSLLAFLSSLTQGASPLAALQGGHPTQIMGQLALTQAPLVFFGLAAGTYYALRRIRAGTASA